jgi:hypothetical protein
VKEWAYAGIFIDLSGAVVTAAANESAAFHIIAPAVLIGILAASWVLRPESRRLPGTEVTAVASSREDPSAPQASATRDRASLTPMRSND